MNMPALCAAAAIVELDAVHVGQWMVSRPIVLGPAFGALCGAPELGAAAGALFELFCVDVLPVGAALPINGSVAVVAFLLLAAGPAETPPAAAFPAALLLGSLFRRLDARVRNRRARLTALAEDSVERGKDPHLGRLILSGLGWHAVATFAFLYLGVLGLGPGLRWAWAAAPETLQRGLVLAFSNAPWLGLAALLYSLKPK